MIDVLRQALEALEEATTHNDSMAHWDRHALATNNLRAAIEQMEKAEPVAWMYRERKSYEFEWQGWHVVGWKPQGPETSDFQVQSLYIAPVFPEYK